MPSHIVSFAARTRVAAAPAAAGHQPLAVALAIAACFGANTAAVAQPAGAQVARGSSSLGTTAGGNPEPWPKEFRKCPAEVHNVSAHTNCRG